MSQYLIDVSQHIVYDGEIAYAASQFNPLIDSINDDVFLNIQVDMDSLLSGATFDQTVRDLIYGTGTYNSYRSCDHSASEIYTMVISDSSGNITNGETGTDYPGIQRVYDVSVEYISSTEYVTDPVTGSNDGPSILNCKTSAEKYNTGTRDGTKMTLPEGNGTSDYYSVNAYYLECNDIATADTKDVKKYDGTTPGEWSIDAIYNQIQSDTSL